MHIGFTALQHILSRKGLTGLLSLILIKLCGKENGFIEILSRRSVMGRALGASLDADDCGEKMFKFAPAALDERTPDAKLR